MMVFTDWQSDPNYLAHFGTKGMKWGQRRFQNPDGTLTALGRERYGKEGYRSARGMTRDLRKLTREAGTSKHYANTLTKQYRIDNLQARKKQALKKGKNEKAERLQKRIEETKQSVSERKRAKAAKYVQNAKRATRLANKIIGNAKKEGFKVTSKERYTTYYTGKQKASQILSAMAAVSAARAMAAYAPIKIGGTAYGFAPVMNTGRVVQEKRYTVRKRR